MELQIYIKSGGRLIPVNTKNLEIVESRDPHPFIIRTVTLGENETFYLDKSKGDYATLSINNSERIFLYGRK